MDPVSKALLGVFWGGWALLGAWTGSEAFAQAAPVPPSTVSLEAAGVPVSLDLGGLTLPGALVVVAVLALRAVERIIEREGHLLGLHVNVTVQPEPEDEA